VAIDHFSKVASALAIKEINTETAVYFIELIISKLGNYSKILVDSSLFFTSHKMKEWATSKGIKLHIVKPSHPEGNRCCQRFVRTLQQTLQQTLVKKGANRSNWHTKITSAIQGYNNSKHSSIDCLPLKCHL
jgi:hypothetical protein